MAVKRGRGRPPKQDSRSAEMRTLRIVLWIAWRAFYWPIRFAVDVVLALATLAGIVLLFSVVVAVIIPVTLFVLAGILFYTACKEVA